MPYEDGDSYCSKNISQRKYQVSIIIICQLVFLNIKDTLSGITKQSRNLFRIALYAYAGSDKLVIDVLKILSLNK
jgi:hypothetical protein